VLKTFRKRSLRDFLFPPFFKKANYLKSIKIIERHIDRALLLMFKAQEATTKVCPWLIIRQLLRL